MCDPFCLEKVANFNTIITNPGKKDCTLLVNHAIK